jgi:hypothetical protein
MRVEWLGCDDGLHTLPLFWAKIAGLAEGKGDLVDGFGGTDLHGAAGPGVQKDDASQQ